MLFHSLLPVIGISSGIISLSAYPPYIRDMFKGTTRPERASWLIWTVLAIIALSSQIASHARWSLPMVIAQTIGVTAVFFLSLKFGYGGLKKRDIISLVVAGLGLIGWAVTNKPVIALICVVVVDAAGAWLTTYKAYKKPSSETLITWKLDSISNFLGLLAVGSLNSSLLLYPAYLLLANGSVVVAIYAGHKRDKKA